jgi:PBP1b-binding outer membrane lipoprotein LpoB
MFKPTTITIANVGSALLLILLFAFLGGCATPIAHTTSGPTVELHPDEDDKLGGSFLESTDIRTIAQKMTVAILTTPEISQAVPPVHIAISPIKNSSRFLIDKNIFMKRLRIELNKVAKNQVRFYSQFNARRVRGQIWRERREERWAKATSELSKALLSKAKINKYGSTRKRVAVGTIKSVNVSGLNADSFLALLRSKLSKESSGKLVFVSRQISEKIQANYDLKGKASGLGAHYLLTGEFIGEGIHVVEGEKVIKTGMAIRHKELDKFESEKTDIYAEIDLIFKRNPNANLWFNAQLINLENDIAVEEMISLKQVMHSGIARADYILSGEISGLSKASGGNKRSDYTIVSFQLLNPDTNEILWEDAYETKRASSLGTVYR